MSIGNYLKNWKTKAESEISVESNLSILTKRDQDCCTRETYFISI